MEGIILSNVYDFLAKDQGVTGVEMDQWIDECEAQDICIIAESCGAGGAIHNLGEDGRVILTSSSEDRPSYSAHELKNGIFTYFLFDSVNGAFSRKDCDYNNDGFVSAEEAFAYASVKTDQWIRDPSCENSIRRSMMGMMASLI